MIKEEPNFEHVRRGRNSVGHSGITQRVTHHDHVVPVVHQVVIVRPLQRRLVLVERVNHFVLEAVERSVRVVLQEVRDDLHVRVHDVGLAEDRYHGIAQAGGEYQTWDAQLVQVVEHLRGSVPETVLEAFGHLGDFLLRKREASEN